MARIEMPHGKDFSSSTFTEERNRCAIRLGYTKCSCAHTADYRSLAYSALACL
jgi:hypothetical protein